jgi:hypothetical protein
MRVVIYPLSRHYGPYTFYDVTALEWLHREEDEPGEGWVTLTQSWIVDPDKRIAFIPCVERVEVS